MFQSYNYVSGYTSVLNVSPVSSRVRFRWATAKIKRFPLRPSIIVTVGQKFDAEYMHQTFESAIAEMMVVEKIKSSANQKVIGSVRLPLHIMVAKYVRLHWYNALLHFHEQAKHLPTDGELRAALSGVLTKGCHPEFAEGLQLAVSRMLEKYPMIRNKVRADELERAKRARASAIAALNKGSV